MQKKLSARDIIRFRRTVYSYFAKHGRKLPWRSSRDPYHILVSEVMLQQTQVDRVILKYKEFLKMFPTARALSRAPLSKVFKVWSGLGYNRRAVALKRCAEAVVSRYNGRIPDTLQELDDLPGIGPHTAGAIMAFAFNKPVVFVETNIRSVFIHHFFKTKNRVHDEDLLPLIEKALDRKNPRKWYSALMDYGSALKKQVSNPSRQSAHHVRQSRFEGSERQLRGMILKLLISEHALTISSIAKRLEKDTAKIVNTALQLSKEGVVVRKNNRYMIA